MWDRIETAFLWVVAVGAALLILATIVYLALLAYLVYG